MSILVSDPLALIAIEAGQVGTPLKEGAASGSSPLDTKQRAAVIGDPVPVVFCRRNEAAGTGGVLISPAATEARFENDASNAVTAYYHLVLSEGQIGSIQVRDVFQRSCRVGSHTQTYNRRAGTWTPGNFITAKAGYAVPECPYYCGSVGVYTGISTLSFQVTIPNGFDQWNRQVHAFIRNGMTVTRLVDGVSGASSNFADLVQWCFANSSRLPAALVDTTALTAAANFMETVGLTCDINITESTNLGDMIAKMAPYFLVTETRNLGKRGLRPLLPVTAGNAIDTGAIAWKYTFTEDDLFLDSFEINYTRLNDRKPFCVQVIWRQQPTDDIGIIRTSEVRYAGTAETGPYEQHDLSAFCTSETHAIKVGTYILARRRYISHTLRFSVKPQIYNTSLTPGDIVRVTLQRVASGSQPSKHDYLYEVNRITKTLAGDLTFELTHFPIDAQGRSLVALDVATAVGNGVMLTSNRTGVSCDINSSSDTTVPPEAFQLGTPLDSQIGLDFSFDSAPGTQTNNPDDGLDQQSPNTVAFQTYPANTAAVKGAALIADNPCPNNTLYTCKTFYSKPGQSFVEFDSYVSSVLKKNVIIVGEGYIFGEGVPYRIRIVFICSDGTETTYEQVLADGDLAPVGSYYTGKVIRPSNNSVIKWDVFSDTWTSYSRPAWLKTVNQHLYLFGYYDNLTTWSIQLDVVNAESITNAKTKVEYLKSANGSTILNYTGLYA